MLAKRTIGMVAAPKDVVVTVRVADAEEHRIRLTDADDIATARKLLAAEAAPETRGTSVRFRVLIDGQPPEAAHGVDVDNQRSGTVTEQRLHS